MELTHEKLRKLPVNLKNYYDKLVEKILLELPYSKYYPDSATYYISFKIPVSKNKEQIFVTFKPNYKKIILV